VVISEEHGSSWKLFDIFSLHEISILTYKPYLNFKSIIHKCGFGKWLTFHVLALLRRSPITRLSHVIGSYDIQLEFALYVLVYDAIGR